jgi:mRNA-degrading endonuclease toxin of MazEF toxin-antitoxin module
MQQRLLVVLPMTTKIREYEFHVFAGVEHTGLRVPGMIMCDQILTIASDRLLNPVPVGHVSSELLAQVEDRVAVLLNLPSRMSRAT